MSRDSKASVPWGGALTLGAFGAIVLGALTLQYFAGQMAGPMPYAELWLLLTGPLLLVSLRVTRTRSVAAGIVCGVVFALPLAAVCAVFRMWADRAAIVVISVIFMMFSAFQRQLNDP
jgi:hypothetical protein